MLFNSLAFLVFFPLVVAGYFALPHRWRWGWLLASSCYFYMYFIPVYILILGVTIVVDYYAGILIEDSTGARRRWMLGASLVANVGVLAVFKYFNFINDSVTSVLAVAGWRNPVPDLGIALPIGLSFHTFQAMSYTIEVYRGHQKAERHPGIYALYVMFFPQLVAGPIERPQNLLHQFHEVHGFDGARAASGLRWMAWGLFQKVFVADRLGQLVSRVYDDPQHFGGPMLCLATVFFAFQIYCDFCGYSCIAIGSAKVLGFRLMENFNRPYSAASVSEFWRRWHISLSTWFRDYIYFPLGGNRVETWRWYRNILVVFMVSGLWHGANWTYVIWGALHGVFIVAGAATQALRDRWSATIGLSRVPVVQSAWGILRTFVLVNIGWVFFRAHSVGDAWHILTHAPRGWSALTSIDAGRAMLFEVGFMKADLLLSLAGIAAVELGPYLWSRFPRTSRVSEWPGWMRWSLYYAVVAVLFFGYAETADQFIYFQF